MKTTISIALIGLASAVSTGAAAQDLGGYLGASVGQSKFKSACDGLPAGSCDDKDTAWKVFGGYNFHRYFGVELGYTDLGDTTASGTAPNGTPATLSFEAKGVELTAVAIWPVNERFSVFGKAGVYRWDVELRGTGGLAGTTDDNGTNFTYGFGMNYYFTPNVGLRAEWQKYNDVGDGNTGRGDVNMISAGVIIKF